MASGKDPASPAPHLPRNPQNLSAPISWPGMPVQDLPFPMPTGVDCSPGPCYATHCFEAALIMMCSLQNNTQACHATLRKNLLMLTQPQSHDKCSKSVHCWADMSMHKAEASQGDKDITKLQACSEFSYLLSSHLISSHLISSHLISSHLQ